MLQRTINAPGMPWHGRGTGLKVTNLNIAEDGASGHFAVAHLRYEMPRPDEEALDIQDVMDLRVRVVPVTAEMTLAQIITAALELGERIVWSAAHVHALDTTKDIWPYR